MTLKLVPMRITVTLAALALVALSAQAQSGVEGRKLFTQKQCNLCHFYEARSTAPSVKTMKAALKGDPAKTSAAISAAPSHANEMKSISTGEIRAIAEWLAASTFEEQAAAQAATPKPGSPEAKRAAAAKARQEAADKAKAAAEAKAQAKRDAEAKVKAAAEAKKEAAAKARQEADAKALAGKDAAAKAKLEAEAKAQAARDAEAQAKREAAAKQEKESLAKREAEAKARKDPVALDAIKRENEERARREAEAQATAKRDAEAKARREADAAAAQKSEADAKARKEAEALAAQKREAEAQAAKKPEPVVAKADPAPKAEPAAPGGKKKIAYRDGSDLPPCPAPTGAPPGAVDEGGAKAVIERVGCPQCHAYVQKKTGPPMKQIHEKYKGDWECVVLRLTKNKTHKEEGVTDDLKASEVKLVSDYIATRNK